MKAAKTLKKLNEMPYPPQKEKDCTSKAKCPNFTNFFRRPKTNNSNLSNEKQRT